MDHHSTTGQSPASHPHHYLLFAVNLTLSLIVMYFGMFLMIDGPGDFRNNLNMLYMALAMVAPMGTIMLLTMSDMYTNKPLNLAIHAALLAMLAVGVAGTRTQTLIGDRQFVASMIPHHSGAILMCQRAPLRDAELRALCDDIRRGQRREIEQMEAIGQRLSRQEG